MEKAVVLPSCQTLFILKVFLVLFDFSVFEVQEILFYFLHLKNGNRTHIQKRVSNMYAQLNK